MSYVTTEVEPGSECECGDRPAHAQLPSPVATAWHSQIAREFLAERDDGRSVVRLEELQRELAAEPPAAARAERLVDYALLAVAAAFAMVSMLLVVSRRGLAIDIALAGTSGLLLAGGHGLLRARRRRRETAHEAQRAVRRAEVAQMLADGEARRQRLDTFSQLAAEIAHEVRNPLGSIVLNASLLEEELHACIHASPEVKRLARAIGSEAERLSALTNEYLTFARVPQPTSTPQPIVDILDEVACFTRGEAARGLVEVDVDADPGVRAWVDPKLARQLLLNLMRNAIDAMPAGGRIDLRASALGERVAVDVIDTGPGVAPELADVIFDPFFSTKPHGTGLGLAVARRVARDHGGELLLMPSTRGAWFRLELPAGKCGEPDEAAKESDVRRPGGAHVGCSVGEVVVP